MRSLRDLLTTWENSSARDTLQRAIERAAAEDQVTELNLSLIDTPTVAPLDALRDATELITLLSGWQWQAVYAARIEQGASWAEIGRATGVSAEQARADYLAAVERQERIGFGDVARYRAAL
jgi:hypothetical protein